MIYLIDHLNSEGNETMSIESNQTDGNLNNDCEIISFPSEEVEEVSKEEIGKWVDQLMETPEPENSFSARFSGATMNVCGTRLKAGCEKSTAVLEKDTLSEFPVAVPAYISPSS